jgi:hypothetical protein
MIKRNIMPVIHACSAAARNGVPSPMHNRAVEHLRLIPIEGRNESKHLILSELTLENIPESGKPLFVGILANSRRNWYVEKKVTNPFFLEESKLHVDVSSLS